MMIISNRFETISSSDKVMVLSNGKFVEYGQPDTLLETPGSRLNILL